MKKYTHESEELNALLGKKVKVTLWHGKTIIGTLKYNSCYMRYGVLLEIGSNYWFCKTHVKKVEVEE